MTDRELLQQALDCLLAWDKESSGHGWSISDQECVDAIRARLEEPPKDLELPLVRPAEFVRLIEGKENYWGKPVMRTEWPMPEPVIQARKEGDLIVADLPQVPRGSGGIIKDEQPEPEPVGWIGYFQGNIVSFLQDKEQLKQFLGNTKPAGKVVPVYTEPPKPTKLITVGNVLEQAGYVKKKEWVGLTDEEARELCVANVPYVIDMVRALEAKLKEKNNG
jgi:hypothetical protein